MGVYDYTRMRIKEDELNKKDLILLCDTVCDRLNLRLGETTLPVVFERIAADATVKLFRRLYYEGIEVESVSDINTHFITDILEEYSAEIEAYKTYMKKADGNLTDIVRFL